MADKIKRRLHLRIGATGPRCIEGAMMPTTLGRGKTMEQKTYIAGEPERTEAYRDQSGALHNSRDDAISANFHQDLMKAVNEYCRDEAPLMPPLGLRHALIKFAKKNPDMLRVLIGDREAI